MFNQTKCAALIMIPIALVAMIIADPATAIAYEGGFIVGWGTQVVGVNLEEDFEAIAAGGNHSLGLKSDGSIAAWGWNFDGQCDVPSPNTGFVDIAAGVRFSVGLKADGSVVAWGYNKYGQCDVPSPNTGFVAIVAGDSHSLGLKEDGSIVAWGSNKTGQCDVPSPNTGFVDIAAGIAYSLGLKADGSIVAWGYNRDGQCDVPSPNTGFVAITAGSHFSLGLKADGSIVAWGGYKEYGQCDVPSPNTGFTAIAAGGNHSLGLKSDGSIVAWGDNTSSECGVPFTNTGIEAVAVGMGHSLGLKASGSIAAWGWNFDGECDVPSPSTGFVDIAAGGNFSVGLKADGSIVAWGSNFEGLLDIPLPNTEFVAIAAGAGHSLGLKADGSIVAWGRNDHGECSVPLPNTGFVAIAAGANHSLGLKANGSIVAWGSNSWGSGSKDPCDIPFPNTQFVAITAGWGLSVGLKADGSIVAWGDNDYGQCDVPSPNTGFVDIAVGLNHSLGLKADGSIVAWGDNDYGQCNVPSPNTGFVAIAAFDRHCLAIRDTRSPEMPALALKSVSPTIVGNKGSVTISFQGEGFTEGVTAKLISASSGELVEAHTKRVSQWLVQATFHVQGVQTGLYDVVVANPHGQEVALPDGITIESGGTTELWAEPSGRAVLRAQTWQKYQIRFGNRGTVDVESAAAMIILPTGFEARIYLLELNAPIPLPEAPDTVINEELGQLAYLIPLGLVAAGSEGHVDIRLYAPNLSRQDFFLSVLAVEITSERDAGRIFNVSKISGARASAATGTVELYSRDAAKDLETRNIVFHVKVGMSSHQAATFLPNTPVKLNIWEHYAFEFDSGFVYEADDRFYKTAVEEWRATNGAQNSMDHPDTNCERDMSGNTRGEHIGWISIEKEFSEAQVNRLQELFEACYSQGVYWEYQSSEIPKYDYVRTMGTDYVRSVSSEGVTGYRIPNVAVTAMPEESGGVPKVDFGTSYADCQTAPHALAKVAGIADGFRVENPDGTIVSNPLEAFLEDFLGQPDSVYENAKAFYTESIYKMAECLNTPELVGQTIRGTVAGSIDPEDKFGPLGYSSSASEELARYIPGVAPITYHIEVWNHEKATASARRVHIGDQLDEDFNWASLRFTKAGLLGRQLDLEPSSEFKQDVDLRPRQNLIVSVEGKLDASTGNLACVFQCYDPNTGEEPEDPTAGFLPAMTQDGDELVWVEFSVQPRAGLVTGTKLTNQATCQMDAQLPQQAPEAGPWVNTIDNTAPTSDVQPLAETQYTMQFDVSWAGQDDVGGCGLRDYTIHVAKDDGPYEVWIATTTETSATFSGEAGKTYAFYSIAHDNIGNTEAPPAVADTTVMIVDDCPNDPNKNEPGICGCGTGDTDSDGDGKPDCIDNCWLVANIDQADTDGNGIGDACDLAPAEQTIPETGTPPPACAPACGAVGGGLVPLILLGLLLMKSAIASPYRRSSGNPAKQGK